MEKLLSTKEVARFLGVNEKMVYTLINEKGLPATRITGKWLFPQPLVEQWVESRTINYPRPVKTAAEIPNLLLIAGSNDLLLDRTLALFRQQNPEHVALFGNLGSLGGLRALRQGLCHLATSHLALENAADPESPLAAGDPSQLPAVVNFCRREQGLLLPRGNPRGITSVVDLGRADITVANRPLEASTRTLFDRELQQAGVDCRHLRGYGREFRSHLEIGLEVLAGRADAGPAIRAAAGVLNLDFLPLAWERFDLLIPKDRFFTRSVQLFLDLLRDPAFRTLAENLDGYDLSLSGRMVQPWEA